MKNTHLHVIDTQSNHINNYNQSFKIDIDIADKERAFNPVQWFKGLVVKSFGPRRRFPQKKEQTITQGNNIHHLTTTYITKKKIGSQL